jgi:hypothetical protein
MELRRFLIADCRSIIGSNITTIAAIKENVTEKAAVLNQQEEPLELERNEFFMNCRSIAVSSIGAFAAIPDVPLLPFA